MAWVLLLSNWSICGLAWINIAFPAVRSVNVHEAKTQFFLLVDAAHAGETISRAKWCSPRQSI